MQDQLIQTIERLLTDLGDASTASNVGVEDVRRLQLRSAEYLRVAAELEAAGRCCRVIERELGPRIDAVLADREGPLSTTAQYRTGPSAVDTLRSISGWLREVFRRGRTASARAADSRSDVSPELHPLAMMLPTTQPRSHRLPHVDVPDADVAALVLGPLELRAGGQWVLRWNSMKARAVFQYLLIHQDRPVRRDVLMELQWPDHSHDSARNNLNVALYSLRNTLDGPGRSLQPVLYRDGCYTLNPELTWWIDRNEFLAMLGHAKSFRSASRPQQAIDAFQRAIDLYRGELFEDDPVGDWYVPEQRQLKELYLKALQDVAEIYTCLGDFPPAARFAQLAISADPCCEAAHRLLMRCFAWEHQQQLVSRQYRLCVTALHDELGVAPAAETVHLFHDLTSTT